MTHSSAPPCPRPGSVDADPPPPRVPAGRRCLAAIERLAEVLAVTLFIFRARHAGPEQTVLGAACIAASWAVLHTTPTLRYARLY